MSTYMGFVVKNMYLLLKLLSKKETMEMTGFVGGFLYSINLKYFLQSPLTSLFRSTLIGGMYILGATFVAACLPKKLRWTVPISVITSVLYLKYKELRNRKLKNDGWDSKDPLGIANSSFSPLINFNYNVNKGSEGFSK